MENDASHKYEQITVSIQSAYEHNTHTPRRTCDKYEDIFRTCTEAKTARYTTLKYARAF